jgi:hypothetical protein
MLPDQISRTSLVVRFPGSEPLLYNSLFNDAEDIRSHESNEDLMPTCELNSSSRTRWMHINPLKPEARLNNI